MTNESMEIGDDLEITQITPPTDIPGTWVRSRLNGHRFDALVFSEHADSPADLRKRLGWHVPIEVRTVRPAMADEVEAWRWDQETLTREAEWQGRGNQ